MMRNSLEAATVERLNLRDQLLANFPDLTEDAVTLADTLAGIDDFEEQCVAAKRYAIERRAHAKAIGEIIEDLTSRKRRLEEGAANIDGKILHAMRTAGISKIRAPDMTISVNPGKPRLVIVDDAAVPNTLCRIRREPDKAAIAEWLAEIDSMQVPNWVRWDEPVPFLSIHRR